MSARKSQTQFLRELTEAFEKADVERVTTSARDLLRSGENLFAITQKLHTSKARDRAWDELQQAFFYFILRLSTRGDIKTLEWLRNELSLPHNFLGEKWLAEKIPVALGNALLRRASPPDLAQEIAVNVMNECPAASRRNCNIGFAKVFGELVNYLEGKRYEYFMESELEEELNRRQQQLKEELHGFYSRWLAEEKLGLLQSVTRIERTLAEIENQQELPSTKLRAALAGVRKVAAVTLANNNVRTVGAAGETVYYDPDFHESQERVRSGSEVLVQSPGLALYADGRPLFSIRKALVRKKGE